MKRVFLACLLTTLLLTSCGQVDLDSPIPAYDTGVDPETWVQIPAGEFYEGQHNEVKSTEAYEIMVTNVTAAQYAAFLNAAVADETLKVEDGQVLGFYPGDVFRGVKHEEEIKAGDWLYMPIEDPAQRIVYADGSFSVKPGYENHPATMVTWFGAWGYCQYNDARLPSGLEWEKAGRGDDTRPFPWGDEIHRSNANFYASRDPFEDMSSVGSRTSPVGFFNGRTYDGYATLDSASPYGLYDMSGNVWQWVGDVSEGMHLRFLRGGSKDTYDMDLRLWVLNNATPTYFSPGVGFRCAR